MSSSTAQLDGSPIQLDLLAKDGTQPYDHISGILKLLHRTRGRDCPDHIWDPDKRHFGSMKRHWCAFLELRNAIRVRVLHLKNCGLSRTYEGNPRQVIDQRGKLGSLDQAVATYLNSLPPSLIPAGAAPRFISIQEEEIAQSDFRSLSESVRDYIPHFQQWQEDMMEDQKRDRDASNALHRLCSLSGRFGNFTLAYRQARVRLGKNSTSAPPNETTYNMGNDIRDRISEVVTLSRTVGPIERATLLLWFQRVVPEAIRLPLPGNVTHFLNQIEELDMVDVEIGFRHVIGLVGLPGLDPRKLSGHIKGALTTKQVVYRPVTLALLRAFLSSKHPINSCSDTEQVKEELTFAEKQMLRLTSEYEADLRLLQAIQDQV